MTINNSPKYQIGDIGCWQHDSERVATGTVVSQEEDAALPRVVQFNPRDPRLLYRQRLSSLCLYTRYNERRLGSARVSRGSRGTPTCGVASGTSVV
jgi:hypothetical protein